MGRSWNAPGAIRGRVAVPAALDALAPVVVLAATGAVAGTPAFRVLVGEDAVFEWAQVLAFALGAAVCLRAARRRARWERAALGFTTAVAVVVVGEELAWGTRLAGVEGTALQEVNRQGEFTLHNVGSGLDASFLALAVVALAAGVAVAARAAPAVPATLASWFAVPALYGAWRLGAAVTYETAKLSEAAELVLALGFARAALRIARSEAPLLAAAWTRRPAATGGAGIRS